VKRLSTALILSLLALLIPARDVAAQQQAGGEFVLITRDGRLDDVRLVEVSQESVSVRNAAGELRTFDAEACIGVVNTAVKIEPREQGMLVLTDGERYPGAPSGRRESAVNTLRWRHDWFGVLDVALERIAWARFDAATRRPEAGEGDVVILANGDRVEGFITSLGDPIEIEVDGQADSIDLDLTRAIRLVNAPEKPEPGTRRVWLTNGTVLDVGSATLGDDGYLSFSVPLSGLQTEKDIRLSLVAGVLFDARSLVPLASIEPHDVVGPPSRYVVPPPRVIDEPAAIDLKAIEMRGPLTARYTLPPDAHRFAALVRLADSATEWADCEVIVRDDDEVVFRAALDERTRRAPVSVVVDGAELTIEIAEGRYGPIQDHVVIEQAMIIRDTDG